MFFVCLFVCFYISAALVIFIIDGEILSSNTSLINSSFARVAQFALYQKVENENVFQPYSSSNQTDLRLDQSIRSVTYLGQVVSKIASFEFKWRRGLLQLTITWYKIRHTGGQAIIIPALGHQNKGKSSFTCSGLFVLMSQCGNNNEFAHQHGGFSTTWSPVARDLFKIHEAMVAKKVSKLQAEVCSSFSSSCQFIYLTFES